MIRLNQPLKPDMQKLTAYLQGVNERNWYTNFGPLHQELTARLEQYLGVDNLLLVSNGTLALQVAFKTFNVKNALTTPFSFVATSSSLLWQEIGVSFCDVDPESLNLDAASVKSVINNHSNIDTIVPTHVYGNPCDVEAFNITEPKVRVIYDAAHAFGVDIDGKSILKYGDASILSFHATKIFHTVEGGAIVFKERADFLKAKQLINFGQNASGDISEIGINAKLNEYQCAVGLTLLDQIDEVMAHRVKLFEKYISGLEGLVGIPKWYKNSSLNGAYMPIILPSSESVEVVMNKLLEANIESRRYFYPSLTTLFPQQVNHCMHDITGISSRIICLPLHYYMTFDDVSKVTKVVVNTICNDNSNKLTV